MALKIKQGMSNFRCISNFTQNFRRKNSQALVISKGLKFHYDDQTRTYKFYSAEKSAFLDILKYSG